jgi:hypothetical protein
MISSYSQKDLGEYIWSLLRLLFTFLQSRLVLGVSLYLSCKKHVFSVVFAYPGCLQLIPFSIEILEHGLDENPRWDLTEY